MTRTASSIISCTVIFSRINEIILTTAHKAPEIEINFGLIAPYYPVPLFIHHHCKNNDIRIAVANTPRAKPFRT